MSKKKEAVLRYHVIIKKLRRFPATFQEIAEALQLESEIQSYNFYISKRTFQRDVEDIRTIYNIDIQYDFSRKVYYINYDNKEEFKERILEAFDTFHALNLSDRLSRHIHFERRHPQGTENLYGLLHAIKNRFRVRFEHQKFWEAEITHREAEPLALKEFQSRWYLVARDLKDNRIKTFGLDRIKKLEITRQSFKPEEDFDVKKYFRYCFGIIRPDKKNEKPQEIILSFDPVEGKYIKSLPLHETQEIVVDNEKEVRVRLKLFVTYDFIMELLSHGNRVKVVKPYQLAWEMEERYQQALKQYQST
jgi:predicted DNA-binding transcriptional regulator YafY